MTNFVLMKKILQTAKLTALQSSAQISSSESNMTKTMMKKMVKMFLNQSRVFKNSACCSSVETFIVYFQRIKFCPWSCDGHTGFPAEISDVLINEEEKPSGKEKGDQKDIHSNEDPTLKTSKASEPVFNPKFSIWIKQVDEVSEVTSTVLPATCTDGNVNGMKTEIDFTPDFNKLHPPQALTEAASDKTSLEKHQIPEKIPTLHTDDHAGKEAESLLSIVLRRANAGTLYIPNYNYSSCYKDLDYSRGDPAEKETCYQPKRSFFQTPNSNDLLSSFHAHPTPLHHCAHQMDKPFRCRLCDKCFKTLGILNVHMKTHSGIRPYQCDECGKSFRDNWNLKVHQKIHTGETPYRCSICDKGFIQYATYMKHQRIHTGEKPYSCCYCDKSFTNSSNLVRHYRTHTGEKPYVCMECGKSFSYNTSLIQHKRIHKEEPAKNCPSN
ncbi:uncharacterized protein LOC142661887 isoform X2 [Rhinoderma darwinii]|uniref:uncharacterized protein LOC142661887 isoform X2 n=1 Tax=Rhinoderma darwinii TaxID=43563 RepID=UPI003F664D6B